MNMRKLLGLLAALTLLLAACGGSSSGGNLNAAEQAKADEIAAQLTADTAAGNPFTDETAAKCFADGIVSQLGLDRINALDTGGAVEDSFANMTTAEQETVADVALGCINFQQIIQDEMTQAGLSSDQATCVANGLNNDLLKQLFLAQIRGEDPTSNADLVSVVTGCLMG
jgi:hypothetical protein